MEDNNITEKLIEEFKNTIPNSEDEQELINAFEIYLYDLKKVIEEFNMEIKDADKVFELSAKKIMKLSLENKKQKLIRDESFEKIQRISNKSFEMTQKMIRGKKLELENNELEKMKKELEESLNNVRDFNKEQAQMLVSEGILDLMFVENPKTEITSLRLGRCIGRKE